MATIRKRENENFVSYEVQVRKKGHGVLTKTFRNRQDAEKWGRITEAEMDRGVFVNRSEAENTTLAETLDMYLKEVTPTKKGADREASRIQRWKTQPIAKRAMASIRGKDIASFRDSERKRGLAENTIRLDIALLSVVFETARKEWGMESLTNPCKAIKLPSGSKQRERRLLVDEEQYLIKGIKECCRNHFVIPIVKFALETAMRQSEILNLEWRHIDLKKSVALLEDTKNGERRRVPLSPKALEVLEALPRDINSGNVFKMTQDGLIRAFRRACVQGRGLYLTEIQKEPPAGFLEDLRFHDLRHESTSRFFETGKLDIMEIASITGHKTLQMLKRYTHLKAEDLAKKLA
ncbi:site-specific integrase [Methylotenera sp.]|uniref:tyrosine-type recombinase/integrase n=1 Tax=Methylotenera sp. TaxID=2051956 RepID=UPI00272F418D|nr:site-specific integrase [Methylotenera sp.]MDP1959017.1 site-specific integrase [Methylotenera sp.]MDP2230354.1 site-specific integrase [Methylotenera sp.]